MRKPFSPKFSRAETRGCMNFAGKALGISSDGPLPKLHYRRSPPKNGWLPPGPAEFAKFALCPDWTARSDPEKGEIEFNSLLMARLPREVLNGLLVRECARLLLLERVSFRYPSRDIPEEKKRAQDLSLEIVLAGISEYCRKRYEAENASTADIAVKRSLGFAAHYTSAFFSPMRFCRTTLAWTLPSQFRRHMAAQQSPSPIWTALFHHPEVDGLSFFEYIVENAFREPSARNALMLVSLYPPRDLYQVIYPLFYLRKAKEFLNSLNASVSAQPTKG